MPGPPVASVAVTENPADPSGQTKRFTVTGAPGPLMWRFGDCTDHEQKDPTQYLDHTYTGSGTYDAIGLVGATGQRLETSVDVAAAAAGITITGCSPSSIAAGTTPTLTITGTGFQGGGTDPVVQAAVALDAGYDGAYSMTNVVVVSDTEMTCTASGSMDPDTDNFIYVTNNAGNHMSATPLLSAT